MRPIIPLVGIALLATLPVVPALSYTFPLKPLGQTERRSSIQPYSPSEEDGTLVTPLTDWVGGSDYQWYSNISIGTPPQNLTVLWNTGFGDIVIPRNNCTTCGASKTFNPAGSSTFAEALYGDTYLSFLRGENSTPLASPELAHCNLAYDNVAIGGLTHSTQAMLLCDDYTPSLASMPIDGMIGLAPYDSAGTNDRSFFWNLWKTHQLNYPIFSLYLPTGRETGAQITLGDIDTTKYSGPIINLGLDPVHYSKWGTWVHHFNAIHVNGTQLPLVAPGKTQNDPFPGAAALLDTSAAFIQVPDYSTARDIYASVSSTIKPIDPSGAWGGSCDEVDRAARDFVISLSGNDVFMNVTVPQSAFNLGEYPGQPGTCQAVFVHNAMNDGFGPYWVLGSPLLKQYYTVWDGLGLQVGWAELA